MPTEAARTVRGHNNVSGYIRCASNHRTGKEREWSETNLRNKQKRKCLWFRSGTGSAVAILQ